MALVGPQAARLQKPATAELTVVDLPAAVARVALVPALERILAQLDRPWLRGVILVVQVLARALG
jgi:hypothetical protein